MSDSNDSCIVLSSDSESDKDSDKDADNTIIDVNKIRNLDLNESFDCRVRRDSPLLERMADSKHGA